MITKTQYEAYISHSRSLWKDDLIALVSSLRNVAIAAQEHIKGDDTDTYYKMARALDALPEWVLEEEA